MADRTMELVLSKKPKNPVIIQGFPGFGLVGTITTEYLIQKLECEQIGKYWFDKLPATIAIHDEKVIPPIGIHFCEKNNLLIIHSITASVGIEWEIAKVINGIAKDTDAKEIISLEGVGAMEAADDPKTFYFATDLNRRKQLDALKVQPLKEGIIVGVTSALLMDSNIPITTLLAETHSELPDSKAAAKLIEVLDGYLGLSIDTKPLIETAKIFEQKINKIMEKSSDIQGKIQKKQLSYVG
jgi:uncharacterized protein